MILSNILSEFQASPPKISYLGTPVKEIVYLKKQCLLFKKCVLSTKKLYNLRTGLRIFQICTIILKFFCDAQFSFNICVGTLV